MLTPKKKIRNLTTKNELKNSAKKENKESLLAFFLGGF